MNVNTSSFASTSRFRAASNSPFNVTLSGALGAGDSPRERDEGTGDALLGCGRRIGVGFVDVGRGAEPLPTRLVPFVIAGGDTVLDIEDLGDDEDPMVDALLRPADARVGVEWVVAISG